MYKTLTKTIAFTVFFAFFIAFLFINKESNSSSLLLENVEALSQSEEVDHYWCCGHTGVCAQGDKLTIKGTFTSEPCKE